MKNVNIKASKSVAMHFWTSLLDVIEADFFNPFY